jgi:hypothetical protein
MSQNQKVYLWNANRPWFLLICIKNFNASNPNNIQTGMIVLHQKFGKGKVLNIEGSADNKLATIFFSRSRKSIKKK